MRSTSSGLIKRVQDGDKQAVAELLAGMYHELRAVARKQMAGRPMGATLSPTGLVNEVFLKLQSSGTLAPGDRDHFFAIAAQAMRWVLNERMDAKRAQKRGGDIQFAPLSKFEDIAARGASDEVEKLSRALARLSKQDPRVAQVVQLRFLGGYSNEEAAHVLGVSLVTVKRDWKFAKTWLLKELTDRNS